MSETPWLDIMRDRLGVAEIPGANKNNPTILGWFAAIGHKEVETDETSWCAVCVGSALVEAGLPIPPRGVNMLARSYLSYGIACEPKAGAIAVWPRGASWQGHVNIVSEVLADGRVICIGGNQSVRGGADAVTRAKPRDPAEALGFRWPVAASAKALKQAGSNEIAVASVAKRAVEVAAGAGAAAKAAEETGVLDQIGQATEAATTFQHFMGAVHGLLTFVASNSLVFLVAVCLTLWLVAHWWQKRRVERARAGQPLSGEV